MGLTDKNGIEISIFLNFLRQNIHFFIFLRQFRFP